MGFTSWSTGEIYLRFRPRDSCIGPSEIEQARIVWVIVQQNNSLPKYLKTPKTEAVAL